MLTTSGHRLKMASFVLFFENNELTYWPLFSYEERKTEPKSPCPGAPTDERANRDSSSVSQDQLHTAY